MNPGVLIIGGGLAGSAAAIQLARAGHTVTLLERTTEPHQKVCGEFLSAEALGYLQELGVDATAMGAVPIDSVQLAGVTRPLPFAAASLTRRALDEELMRVAAAAGVRVERGARVQSLQPAGSGWCARLDDATVITAETVFLATGKHDLLGHPRPAGKQSGLVGLKMYFRLSPEQKRALSGRVELILYRGGYAGLQPVEGGAANLCCLVESRLLRSLGGRWENLLASMQQECPHLRERLQGASPLLDRALAISSIPYGYVRTQAEAQPGLWMLGDQSAVIPSFTGDGMSIALHSGLLAAALYAEGATSHEFQARLHRGLARQVGLATAVSRGLVSPMTRPLMMATIRLFPGLLGLVATRTRIAEPVFSAQHPRVVF